MKRRFPISIRLASTLTVAALAACGGGGGDAPASTPTGTNAAAPAASPSPAPAPAPASGYPMGDAVRGKAKYSDLPNTGTSCDACHGAALGNGVVLRAAGNPEYLARAISNNAGGTMRQLQFPVLNGQDLADITAYLVTPGI